MEKRVPEYHFHQKFRWVGVSTLRTAREIYVNKMFTDCFQFLAAQVHFILTFGHQFLNTMKFEHEKDQILQVLEESLTAGNVVGIEAREALGTGVFVTAVENILKENNDIVITFKHYDASGYMLKKHKLLLEEIDCVCRFTSTCENPYYKQLTGVRFHQIN